jgi:hypothetical protein
MIHSECGKPMVKLTFSKEEYCMHCDMVIPCRR